MKVVIQRVKKCVVTVEGQTLGRIDAGLLVLLGIAQSDDSQSADELAQKVINLRIFEDDKGKMNRSLLDIGGDIMVVSQFTLMADCRKGRRPSYTDAAGPVLAESLYHRFVTNVRRAGVRTQTGQFGSRMSVDLINDGPVTLIVEHPV